MNTLPRVALVHAPTPLVKRRRLDDLSGIDLWIKRDDMTGGAEAGNKIRKLEWLLGEAVARGADTFVACGGLQSNLLDRMAGAEIRKISHAEYAQLGAIMESAAIELRDRGRRPYVVPEGGSNGLGALGETFGAELA